MRIGIDASSVLGWRGPSRNIRNLIIGLSAVDRANQYHVYAPFSQPTGMMLGANFTWVHLKTKPLIPWVNVLLPFRVLRDRLDVFVFPQDHFWLWKVVPTVIFFRATVIAPFEHGVLDAIEARLRILMLRSIGDNFVFSSQSAATMSRLVYGLSERSVHVINNAVEPGINRNRAVVRPLADKYLLYVGGTEGNKNVSRLLQAFRTVIKNPKRSDLKLVIVGGKYGKYGMTDAQMQEELRSLGLSERVLCPGQVKQADELSAWYHFAEMLVFPSLTETFGLVPLEAMACGCPVASSFAPAMPEILGEAVLFFNPYEVKDIAEKVCAILQDTKLRHGLIKKGLAQVARYDWEKSAAELLEIIEMSQERTKRRQGPK